VLSPAQRRAGDANKLRTMIADRRAG
jgi:hypothetical protein